MTNSPTPTIDITFLRRFITEGFLDSFGLPTHSWARPLLRPILWTPASLFTRLAAKFDNYVGEYGFDQAARWLLPRFVDHFELSGQENIPKQDPLIVACNHPGNIDALSIAANLPRDDLKILAIDIPLVQGLPHTSQHFIYSTIDNASAERMLAVRSSIRHLRAGGSLLIFPAGHISPDTGVIPGAEEYINNWYPSLQLFLRKVPDAKLQLAFLSHVTLPRFFQHPILGNKEDIPRQILAQFLQLAFQVLFPRRWLSFPKFSFAPTLTLSDLQADGDPFQSILTHAKSLVRKHVHQFGSLL